MCRGTGPGKAFTLASLRQVLAGGGAGPWCLPADCGGEEPSEKEKGEDLDFVAQGLPKRGAHTLGSTKDDLLGCQKKLLDFLLYIFLISCSKSMFVSCNEWSFFFLLLLVVYGIQKKKKNAGHCTKICQLH